MDMALGEADEYQEKMRRGTSDPRAKFGAILGLYVGKSWLGLK